MGRRRAEQARAGAAGALPDAVAALSRTLPAGPSPETFRRAKFDRPEAVRPRGGLGGRAGRGGHADRRPPIAQAPPLWRTLFLVLSPLPGDCAPAPGAPPAPPALEAQVRLVKRALRSQGYPRRALAQLPEDGARGSRELLLALAWLLARGPLLERLLGRTRVRLGDEVALCQCEAPASPGPPAACGGADGPVDIRHLQWLMGKLRLQWRNLMTSQQEHCALLGKIHSYTRGCHSDRSLGHLSVAETEMLRDPEGGRQLLRRLESENARLEAALAWRRRELVFWQWMDTVLGACPLEAAQPPFLPRIPESGADQLEMVAQQLQALHEELQGAVEPRRAAWEARVGGLGSEWSALQRATQEAVGQELAALRQAWEQGGAPAQPHGSCRLVKSDARASGGPGLRAAEVIGELRSREACLEAVLRQLQSQCRQELARLAAALPGLIWILPPGH
ncbi:tubulin epsilon and delta complex protein 1 isoform X2 [Vulpes lagopus]|uniref:tubulin epsilon and delta complex protein 1 isoform X2 n=1 Tax=Vulpes lagopus TaxID=494514 RepID=UPI001BC92D8A|nr:tubulin epsilon and delta complex protein 1 isoform X2 [Vulpes lagopus]